MKIETRKFIKEVEKELKTSLKDEVKKTDVRIVSQYLYLRMDGLFFYAIWFVRYIDEQVQIVFPEYVKGYVYDDLFWEIFDMEENKNQRESLRANGAFTAPSIQWDEKKFLIRNIEEVKTISKTILSEFISSCEKFSEMIDQDIETFDSYTLKQSGMMDEELLKMLTYIHMGNIVEAEKIAQSEIEAGNLGRLHNNGKWINEYILDYCREKKF